MDTAGRGRRGIGYFPRRLDSCPATGLKDDSDLTAHRACLSHDIVSGDPHSAGSEAKRRGKNRDRGRLSGPVRTEEREELPLLHVEADTIDGVRTALSIPLHQVATLNRGRHF